MEAAESTAREQASPPPWLVVAAALLGCAVVVLAQVPRVQFVGAFLSAALWFGVARAASVRVSAAVGAVTGLLIALGTRWLLVELLHFRPEVFDGTPGIGSLRIIGSSLGIIVWPIVGGIVSFLFARVFPVPTSRVVAAGTVAFGGVISISVGTAIQIALVTLWDVTGNDVGWMNY